MGITPFKRNVSDVKLSRYSTGYGISLSCYLSRANTPTYIILTAAFHFNSWLT